jgi:hypothetical protein
MSQNKNNKHPMQVSTFTNTNTTAISGSDTNTTCIRNLFTNTNSNSTITNTIYAIINIIHFNVF